MDNTATILNFFESGYFYLDRNYSRILKGDAHKQMNDLLIWVDTFLFPGLVAEMKYLEDNEISLNRELAISLRKRFSDIISLLEARCLDNQQDLYICNICKNRRCHCNLQKGGFWYDLQDNEQLEVALVSCSNSKRSAQTSPANPGFIEKEDNLSNKNMVGEASEFQTNSQNPAASSLPLAQVSPIANDLKEVAESVTKVLPMTTDSKEVAPPLCSECNCNKFNFVIDYDPNIKSLLYGSKYFEVVEVHGVEQSTIQFRDGNIFVCLICSVEAGYEKSFKTIREHMCGQRHRKNKGEAAVQALLTYHENWIKMENAHLAHQLYFYPADTVTLCRLCCTYVPYDKLDFHILSATHMGFVMKLYRKDKPSILLQLQASAYFPELAESIKDDLAREIQIRPSQKITTNSEKEKPNNMLEEGKVDNLSELKEKSAPHDIVVSIANASGKNLTDILEHRFLPHLSLIDVAPMKNTVKCRCCQVVIPFNVQHIKEHLYSKEHINNCNLQLVKWRFYCEICDFRCVRNERWTKHLQDIKHRDWCSRLGSARKSKLCEYECNTCSLIIYGDELSLTRHLKGLKRRKKELVLGIDVKEAFKSEKHIQVQCEVLVAAANNVLFNPNSMIMCCRALEEALSEAYPNCKVHPFGSRVSGLGNENSDLDVFVDLGDMYLGTKNQDAQSQENFVKTACRIFRNRKTEFSHLNPIPGARTPIIQIFHKASNIDCDLSFRNGLSVENSKFLRFCIEVQPVTQALILLLKKWIVFCNLNEDISTYALSMLVIYFLQVKNYLLSVQELKLLNPRGTLIIDGWTITDFSDLHDSVRSHILSVNKSMKQLLIEFFDFYKVFDYPNDVVCPLLGHSVKKSVFINPTPDNCLPLEMLTYAQKLSNPNAEIFRAKSYFCVQDPFDLSHNLAKACCQGAVAKLVAYCDLSSKYLKIIQ